MMWHNKNIRLKVRDFLKRSYIGLLEMRKTSQACDSYETAEKSFPFLWGLSHGRFCDSDEESGSWGEIFEE